MNRNFKFVSLFFVAILFLFNQVKANAVGYEVVNQNNPVVLLCTQGVPNCKFYSGVMFKNVTGKTIYDTVAWVSGSLMQYTNQYGQYVNTQTLLGYEFEPGTGPNLGVRVIVPTTWNPGIYHEKLYLSGKLCNVVAGKLDCYYADNAVFDVEIRIKRQLVKDPIPTITPFVKFRF